MIRLHRTITPVCLSPNETRRLSEEFRITGRDVWNQADIKSALLHISHHKCAYCEARLGKESVYLEVEHFYSKSNHPQKVLEWDNLLPSCRRCNASKGNHDVALEPIINPFDEDPRTHLRMHLYRLEGKTLLGSRSVEVMDLNHSARASMVRFEIGESIARLIILCAEKLALYISQPTNQRLRKLGGSVLGLLLECQPTATYAATSSTVLHSSVLYGEFVDEMKSTSNWTTEMECLHQCSMALVL